MTAPPLHTLGQLAVAANRRYWTGWACAEADPDADLTVYRSDIAHSKLNGILRVRDQPLDAAIAEARQRLKGTPWIWWVGADSDPGTADGLLARGARQVSDLPVMAIDVTAGADFDAPADLAIRTVTDPAEMSSYVQAYAEPMGFDSDDLTPVVERELGFAYPEVVRLAAIIDGRTVGTCTMSLGTDVGALYCITTDPRYRRRGIASALTLEGLRLTRESGRSIATLVASSAGEPVYRRLGFETVSRYGRFTLPD
ncbi:GNAT family N-acetyltransferase [Catellatospora paridis]|uniref:GNAT family N-acetyltransferase n=1 Tax=Catellatospora paridis TaxID=1617086 RepID=UPI0018AFD70F|nr:GNAT family N-acetyltransferase [Catellatospora paridis]